MSSLSNEKRRPPDTNKMLSTIGLRLLTRPSAEGHRPLKVVESEEPVLKVERVARMGIDAQRSGASELRDRAVEVRRAQGATTKAIPVWIVPSAEARVIKAEQRLNRPHSGPCNLRQTDDGRAQHSGPYNLRPTPDGRAQHAGLCHRV